MKLSKANRKIVRGAISCTMRPAIRIGANVKIIDDIISSLDEDFGQDTKLLKSAVADIYSGLMKINDYIDCYGLVKGEGPVYIITDPQGKEIDVGYLTYEEAREAVKAYEWDDKYEKCCYEPGYYRIVKIGS